MSIRTKLNETVEKTPYIGKILTADLSDKIVEIMLYPSKIMLYPIKLPDEEAPEKEKLETGIKITKVLRNVTAGMALMTIIEPNAIIGGVVGGVFAYMSYLSHKLSNQLTDEYACKYGEDNKAESPRV